MTKSDASEPEKIEAGEQLAEHLLDLVGGAGSHDLIGEPHPYRQVTWTKAF
jgi:hypothetical protein